MPQRHAKAHVRLHRNSKCHVGEQLSFKSSRKKKDYYYYIFKKTSNKKTWIFPIEAPWQREVLTSRRTAAAIWGSRSGSWEKKIRGSRSGKSSGYTEWYWCTPKKYLKIRYWYYIYVHICWYYIRCIFMNYMIRCDFRTWKIWRLQWTLKQKFGEMVMSPSVTKTQMSICHVPGPLRLQRCHWSALWCASR